MKHWIRYCQTNQFLKYKNMKGVSIIIPIYNVEE